MVVADTSPLNYLVLIHQINLLPDLYVITPAVREHGYAVVRADLSAEPGIVTVHVIQHLRYYMLRCAPAAPRWSRSYSMLELR
jgi:hypothetical protein